MGLRVTLYTNPMGESNVKTFPNNAVPKVLQSGALKIVQLVETDIPVMGEEVSEDIIKAEEVVLGVFFGNYIMERIQ